MEKITFTCEIVTPVFMYGAEGSDGTPEFRPSSVKGAMRFWWRAANGALGLSEMKTKEGKLFGIVGDDKTSSRSSFSIQISEMPEESVPTKRIHYKDFGKNNKALSSKQTFSISLRSDTKETLDKAADVFVLSCLLGGFGGRSRRGFGSITIKEKNGQTYMMPTTIDKVLELLYQVSGNEFKLATDDSIIPMRTPSGSYPFIKQIQLGHATKSQVTDKVADAAHETKKNNATTYDASLGYAKGRKRFASPVYTSVIEAEHGQTRPIITTLHAQPEAGDGWPNTAVQEQFKNKIL